MDRPGRRATVAWGAALLGTWLAFALLAYGSRDPDSRLYAEIAARMANAPVFAWIAPEFPPGWFMSGLFREHPPGLFWPAAILARLGYPAAQAAYAANAAYQVATLVLLPALAATLVPASRARALGWALQLLPIAFTYRVRANHEQAVLLGLVVALVATEKSRRHARWAALTAAALAFLLLVKGVFALFAPLLCALWLLAAPKREGAGAEPTAWYGLAAATLAMVTAAAVYELLYRWASGEPFWSFYLSRQLGVATAGRPERALLGKAANAVFYVGRILWFAFPWSLVLVYEGLVTRRGAKSEQEATAARRPGAALFVAGTVLVYVLGFSLFDRRADRYVFPAYYAVGAAGVLAALAGSPRFTRLAERLDRPWFPACVFALTLALHLVAGRLGLPRIDVSPSR